MFGVNDESNADELDKAAADGENGSGTRLLDSISADIILLSTANELAELRKEAEAIKEIRATLGQPASEQKLFDKVGLSSICILDDVVLNE